jgi:hypothetical protein
MFSAIRRLCSQAEQKYERRRACRYPIAEAPVYLGWWEGAEFRTTTAKLVDLSVQGASVLAGESPGVGPVWLCPCQSAPSSWAEGRAVAVEPETAPGAFRRCASKVRVEFVGPCSYDLFKSGTGTTYVVKPEDAPEDAVWGRRS